MADLDIKTTCNAALNERDFGDLTGLHHKDTIQKFGAKQVKLWRNAYDIPPPNGESLKDTYQRILPYFKAEILPKYMAGNNIIIVSHNVTLKALILHLTQKTIAEIEKLNLINGQPMLYHYDEKWINTNLS